MRKFLLAGIAAAAILSAPAFAADMPVKAPAYVAPAPLFNWSGFYAGGHLGWAWGDVDWDNVTLTGERVRTSDSAFLGGGQIGYNWQFNPNWVIGTEATLSGTDLKDTVTSVVNPAFVTYTNKLDLVGTVVGRLGYAWDRSLFYVTGGYAYARFRTAGLNTGIDSFSLRDTESGWTIGGGWEYAWTNNWIFGIDYKHIDLGSSSRSGTTAGGLPFTITGIDPRIDMVTVRLSYKFGDWGKGPVVAKY